LGGVAPARANGAPRKGAKLHGASMRNAVGGAGCKGAAPRKGSEGEGGRAEKQGAKKNAYAIIAKIWRRGASDIFGQALRRAKIIL
jgi:hypothetical protein